MGFIRFLLACGVVLGHTSMILGYTPLSGNLAVQCFYIISGFYMSLILNEKYVGAGSTKLFYSNRALKIYPLYWVVLVLVIGWCLFVNKLGYPSTFSFYKDNWPLSTVTLLYLVIANATIIGLDWSFFFGLKNGNLYFTKNFNATNPNVYNFSFNSIAWTVGVELVFYLFAPFVLKRGLLIISVIFLASLALRVVLVFNGLSFVPWDYMFFPTQVMFFMGGAMSYHIYLWQKKLNLNKTVLQVQYFILVIAVLFYYRFFDEGYTKQACLFISFVLLMPASFVLFKNSKIDRYIGNLSYPIYISQCLVVDITTPKNFPHPFGRGASAVIVVILLSILLERYIAIPIERYRQKRVLKALAKV